MEALDSLGLEVTNANVNSFRGLVSNVFKVEVIYLKTIHAPCFIYIYMWLF